MRKNLLQLVWSIAPLGCALLILSPPARPQNLCERLNALNDDGTFCDLRRKGISQLKLGDFEGLPNLQHLTLYNNNLQSLPPGIFDTLPYLQKLYLGANNLTVIPLGVFSALPNLYRLDLSENPLICLPKDLPDSLEYLSLKLDLNPSKALSNTKEGFRPNEIENPSLPECPIGLIDIIDIPEQNLTVGSDVKINLSDYFKSTSFHKNPFTYTVTSNDPSKAEAWIDHSLSIGQEWKGHNHSILSIKGVEEGSTRITVAVRVENNPTPLNARFTVNIRSQKSLKGTSKKGKVSGQEEKVVIEIGV